MDARAVRATLNNAGRVRILYCPLLEMLTAGGSHSLCRADREWKPGWRQPSTLGSQEIAPWFAPHVRLLPLTTFHILKVKIKELELYTYFQIKNLRIVQKANLNDY